MQHLEQRLTRLLRGSCECVTSLVPLPEWQQDTGYASDSRLRRLDLGFSHIADVPPAMAPWNRVDTATEARKKRDAAKGRPPNPAAARAAERQPRQAAKAREAAGATDSDRWESAPLAENTLLYWLLRATDAEFCLTMDPTDIASAVAGFRSWLGGEMAGDGDFLQEFTAGEEDVRNPDRKKKTETLMRFLHSQNYDQDRHGFLVSYVLRKYNVHLHDAYGGERKTTDVAAKQNNPVIVLREMRDGTYQSQPCNF